VPYLNPGEIILFRPFIKRGLGLPPSHFLLGLLHFYGITLNHLTPNSIFHLSIFVHLRETFIGIPASIMLFHYYFELKPKLDATNPEVVAPSGSNSGMVKRLSLYTTL
jgi:hypothetical protein